MSSIIDHSFFFTPLERDHVALAKTNIETRPSSFVTFAFYPLWSALSRRVVSDTVAPNAITLTGLVSSMQSYQIISNYRHSAAREADDIRALSPIIMSCILCIVSLVCGSLDGVHAKRCRSATPLGDIFSRICSSVSRVFFALTLLEVFEVKDLNTQWYLVMALQLIEFNTVLSRINADNLKQEKAKNFVYHFTYCFRDSELSFIILCILILRLFIDLKEESYFFLRPRVVKYTSIGLILVSFINISLLRSNLADKVGMALCLAPRIVPHFRLLPFTTYNTLSVISGSFVVALLSIEVYVSKVAKRKMHSGVIFICIGSMFNDVFATVMPILYVIGVIVDLSYSTRIPLFVPVRNVYCDGVFDLCHAGHKKFMQNSLAYGNRLIVGVCGDTDCEKYKRRPIMTLEERVNEVQMCKFVSQVIPNSPTSGVTLEMIQRHNIHVVVCGKEYDRPDDPFYAVPRALGILRMAPRTEGISTSALIARIRAATEDGVRPKDKERAKQPAQEHA